MVSGEITPDNFVVEKVLLEIASRRVVEKDHELVADRAARRTIDRGDRAERRTLPSLTDQEIIAVARLAKSLEKLHGLPAGRRVGDRPRSAGRRQCGRAAKPAGDSVEPQARLQRREAYAPGIEGVLGTLISPLQRETITTPITTCGGASHDHACEISESVRSEGSRRAPRAGRSCIPYYLLFQDKLREQEDGKFWFCDSQHWPSPFKPFDTVTVEFAVKCLGQYNTRHYLVPPANGVDYRIHNGYLYMSPVAVAPETIRGRVPQFLRARRLTISRTGTRCWRTGTRRSAPTSPIWRRSSSKSCRMWSRSNGSRTASASTTPTR